MVLPTKAMVMRPSWGATKAPYSFGLVETEEEARRTQQLDNFEQSLSSQPTFGIPRIRASVA